MTKSGFAKEHLRSFIDRVERLEEEKSALTADIREVFAEAKGSGFDTKIMRQVIRLRKLDKADFQEQQAILDLYMSALGMLGDTPLGQAAIKTETDLSPDLRRAAKKFKTAMGESVPLTPEEKDTGVIAAFVKDGTRCSIGFPENEKPPPRSAA